MCSLFSIIIPVYNVEPYLRKCLDSVINQTCNDWECICVDDGSPDNCGKILDEYAAKDNRIIVIHQANGGVSVARNVALDKASGEWVQFLDSDDSLELDFLEKLKQATAVYPDVDAIEHTAIYCYNDGRREYGIGRLPPKCVVNAQEILSDPFGKRLTSLGRCACYKIFRRCLLEANYLRFISGIPIGEDTLFAAQFYVYAGKVAICPEIAGYLRIYRENSALATIRPQKLIPRIYGCEVLYEIWLRHSSRGLAIRLCAEILSLAYLGKDLGEQEALVCREAVLSSSFFQKKGLTFLAQHGTWKMRLFAIVMLIVPKGIQSVLLTRMNCK